MPPSQILLPVFIQVALTFALLCTLGPARLNAVRTGQVKVKDIALGQNAWPERVTLLSNCFNNQLQLPVLFYALAAMALAIDHVDSVLVGLAWVFVALRLIHAAVHVTTNYVPHRFYAYIGGVCVLIAMWVWFAIGVMGA